MPAEVALRAAENNALTGGSGSFYSGSGRNANTPKVHTKLSGINKKGLSAMIIIIGLLAGGMAFIGSSHSLLISAMSVLGDLSTNSQNTAIVRRLPKAANAALSKINQKGWPSTANSALTNKLNGNTNVNVSEFSTNAEVRSTLTSTVNGRAGGYYSDMAESSFVHHGDSRNVLRNFEQTNDSEADLNEYRSTINEQLDGRTSANLTTTKQESVEDLDEDGKGTGTYHAETVNNEVAEAETKQTYSNQAEAEAAASSHIAKLASEVSKIVTWGCTALQIGILISTAYQVKVRVMQQTGTLNFMESSSKTMAGYGTQAGANAFLNTITRAAPTSDPSLDNASISVSDEAAVNDTSDDVIPQDIVSIQINGTEDHNVSAVESDGLLSILLQKSPNPAKSYNYSSASVGDIIRKELKALGVTMLTCLNLQTSIAAMSLAVEIVPGIGQAKAIGSVAWSSAKDIATKILRALGGRVLINVAVSSIVLFIVPLLARAYLGDSFTNFVGYTGGQNLAGGLGLVSSTLGRNATGQSLASKEVAVAYNHETQNVIAWEAEVDRLNRSPFDITSKNTFLGNIVYGLLPSTLSSSPSQGITSVSSLIATTSNALATVTGQVSAAGEGTAYNTTFGQCEDLEEIGAACNAFGGEITVTDPEILDIDVTDSTYASTIANDLDCNGDDCKVKDNSGLAKYIKYCAMRDTPFGVYDVNIEQDLQNQNVFLGALPIIGNALEIINNGIVLKNQNIINGKFCVASSENPDWETNKYYSLYLADNHILDQWGAYDNITNPVLSYMEKVYAEQEAEDNSYVAQLSRLIGASKEDTELMLDTIAYYQFLDDYDASTRLAMTKENTTIPTSEQIIAQAKDDILQFAQEDDKVMDIIAPQTKYTAYADVRNRSYAV